MYTVLRLHSLCREITLHESRHDTHTIKPEVKTKRGTRCSSLPRGRYGIHAQRLSHDRRPCRKPVCGFTREPVYSPLVVAAFTCRDPILLPCPQLTSPRGSWKTRLLPSPSTSSHYLPPPSISFSRPQLLEHEAPARVVRVDEDRLRVAVADAHCEVGVTPRAERAVPAHPRIALGTLARADSAAKARRKRRFAKQRWLRGPRSLRRRVTSRAATARCRGSRRRRSGS